MVDGVLGYEHTVMPQLENTLLAGHDVIFLGERGQAKTRIIRSLTGLLMTILLFNNRIYGLTKGQYSPTSEPGKITKSTPAGSVDHPFNPVSLALGADATFVARTIDSTASTSPRCCPRPPPTVAPRWWRSTRTARSSTTAPSTRSRTPTPRPTRSSRSCRVSRSGSATPARTASPARGSPARPRVASRWSTPPTWTESDLLVHDAHADDPTTAFGPLPAHRRGILHQSPIGVFRQVERPTYDDQARAQIITAATGQDDQRQALTGLINGGDTWTVV